jgi:hypothetical protein
VYSAVLSIDTPALLFPAISFVLLAYTTRYLALAELIRKLLKEFEERPHLHLHQQIAVLKRRVNLIRQMQTVAIVAMLLCIVAMLLLYLNDDFPGKIAFGVALIAMVGSLILAMLEVQASTHALDIELDVANREIAPGDGEPAT